MHLTVLTACLLQLRLDGLSLVRIPPKVFSVGLLSDLDVSLNHLAAVPHELQTLTALTKLNMDGNRLKGALVDAMTAFWWLPWLTSPGCCAAELPATLWHMTTLTALFAGNNRLRSLRNQDVETRPMTPPASPASSLASTQRGSRRGSAALATSIRRGSSRLSTRSQSKSRSRSRSSSVTGSVSESSSRRRRRSVKKAAAVRRMSTSKQGSSTKRSKSKSKSKSKSRGRGKSKGKNRRKSKRGADSDSSGSPPPMRTVVWCLGSLTSLRTLHVHGNKLTAVPSTVARLTDLQALRLDANRLVKLPKCITALTSLTELTVQCVPCCVPVCCLLVPHAHAYTRLCCNSHNPLRRFPAPLALPLLQTLDASCSLLEVPPDLRKASSLTSLHLHSAALQVCCPLC